MHIYILLRSNIIKCVNKVAKCAFRAEAVTSQVCPYRSARSLTHPSRSALPPPPAAPQKAWLNLWEVAAWEIAQSGNCLLELFVAWEITFGKIPLGKYLWEITFGQKPLRKYLWENSFGKKPNTFDITDN